MVNKKNIKVLKSFSGKFELKLKQDHTKRRFLGYEYNTIFYFSSKSLTSNESPVLVRSDIIFIFKLYTSSTD